MYGVVGLVFGYPSNFRVNFVINKCEDQVRFLFRISIIHNSATAAALSSSSRNI